MTAGAMAMAIAAAWTATSARLPAERPATPAAAARPAELEIPPPWRLAPAAPPDELSKNLNIADDDSQGALKLVYSHKLPGQAETILERIGLRSEAFLDTSPWQVERLGRDTYLITFTAPGGDREKREVYEFEADLAARTVACGPDTEALLRAGPGGTGRGK